MGENVNYTKAQKTEMFNLRFHPIIDSLMSVSTTVHISSSASSRYIQCTQCV